MTTGRPTAPEAAAEIIRLYRDEGLSIRGVHAKTGIGEGPIARLVREAGVSRPVGRYPIPPETTAAIAAACDSGMTLEQAAARFGVGVTGVKTAVRTRGPAPGMLTAAQAAALLGVPAPFMSALARTGLVRASRPWPRAQLRYVAADVAALAALRARLAEITEPARPAGGTGT